MKGHTVCFLEGGALEETQEYRTVSYSILIVLFLETGAVGERRGFLGPLRDFEVSKRLQERAEDAYNYRSCRSCHVRADALHKSLLVQIF